MRILGQVLLWTGFLAAAIAAVSKKEFDFLADAEKEAFKELNKDAWFTKFELEQWAGEIREMDSDAFVAFLKSHTTEVNDRAAAEKEYKRLKDAKLSSLSTKEINLLSTKFIDQFRAAAEAREKEEQNKKDGIKPPSKTDEQLAIERKKSTRVNKEQLIKLRTVELPNRWTTVRWFWYAAAMIIGIAGVVLLRMQSKAVESDTVSTEAEFSIIAASMKTLQSSIAQLKENLDEMEPEQVVHFIDDQCSTAYADFAEARNALRRKFGLQGFADIMTQFSSAERMTNRAWSAAADGYMNEVKDCVELASIHISKTSDLIAENERSSTL